MQGRLVGTEAASAGGDALERRASLFRLVATGRPQAIAGLATTVCGDARPDSLAAVVGALEALREAGMPLRIDAAQVRAEPFVPLDALALRDDLSDLTARRWDARVVFETGSTNADLLRDVRAGPTSSVPIVLTAEVQRAGRGRLGRAWVAAPGASITASFALPIARPLAALDGVTLACGLAVRRVVSAHGVVPRLKWPNDLLIDGRKLAGILVEAHALAGSAVLVVGVGLNLCGVAGSSSSPEVACLPAAGPAPIDRNRLVAELAVALQTHLATFERDGFAPFAAPWNAGDAFSGRSVTVGTAGGPRLTGIAHGVDDRGALRLDVDGVRTTIVAGDVSLRPAARADGREVA